MRAATIFYLLMGSLILLSACKDDGDTDFPVLEITSPAQGAVFNSAQLVQISGRVEDESLHDMDIVITDVATQTVLFSASPYIHAETAYNFSENWTPTGIASPTQVKLKISVEDHSDHITSDSLTFTVNP